MADQVTKPQRRVLRSLSLSSAILQKRDGHGWRIRTRASESSSYGTWKTVAADVDALVTRGLISERSPLVGQPAYEHEFELTSAGAAESRRLV